MAKFELQLYTSNNFRQAANSLFAPLHCRGAAHVYGFLAEQAAAHCPYNISTNRPRSMLMRAGPVPNWEGRATAVGYRLDFQGYTQEGFANWQVQSGDRQTGVAAQVLMSLDHEFGVGQFAEAIRRSLENRQICRLLP
jgi:hypothetical protein